MACNMCCKYCYLEDNTIDDGSKYKSLETLEYAINKFKNDNVIPFNISLHGGEVTTLSKGEFHDLIEYISDYYEINNKLITDGGFKIGRPHIKTNLYDLQKHIETIKKFNVSISGSLDLPLSLHDEYRVTKGNQKTLKRILENIELLKDIPNKKKVSATIFKEHYNHIDEIIDDIKFLHKNTCLDMNDFNFMIGFDYNSNGILHHMTEKEQVEFYKRMHKEFDGTDLDYGVNGPWFDEFGPEYCTNCDNCGEKFFLLERNGDIYSCVRGQKNSDFYYGNIYNDSVEKIMNNAKIKIFENHNRVGFNEECVTCKYLYLCKTGCPYVKNIYHINKSYTCKLQQEIYKDNHELYPEDNFNDENVYIYLNKMHPNISQNFFPNDNYVVGDIPNLKQIIMEDEKLKNIYSPDIFILKIDDFEYKLESQVIKKSRDIIYLTDSNIIRLYIKKGILEDCLYPANNSLYLMLLSGETVTYGDERRTKQEHIMTHQIYTNTIIKNNISDKEDYYCVDITKILSMYYHNLSTNNPNNLFFTTSELRDYHYTKQKNNAYYHIQAINLPFQNIEFLYIDIKEEL